jgi:uncharacterized radical SAM superfamily protein
MLSSIKTILCCLGLLFAFSTGFATELTTEQPKNKRVNVFILETMGQTSMISTIQKVMFAFTE